MIASPAAGGCRQFPAGCCRKLPASSYAFSRASTRSRRSVLPAQAASKNAVRSSGEAFPSASTKIPSIDCRSTLIGLLGTGSAAGAGVGSMVSDIGLFLNHRWWWLSNIPCDVQQRRRSREFKKRVNFIGLTADDADPRDKYERGIPVLPWASVSSAALLHWTWQPRINADERKKY